MTTFADGRSPLVLAAIKEAQLPCRMVNGMPCYQSFNNGAVYNSNQTPDDQRSIIEWKEGMQNFKSFFSELSKMPVKSLQMTKSVLISRESLHITNTALEKTINVHLMKMEELRKIKEAIGKYENKVNANKNFEIKIKVNNKTRAKVGELTSLNCKKCETTCHYPCDPNWGMGVCPAFWPPANPTVIGLLKSVFTHDQFGRCKVCPGKCSIDDHTNEETTWSYIPGEETMTLYDVRKKYEKAVSKQMTAEELQDSVQAELEDLKQEMVKSIQDITRCSNLLKKIALRGDPLTTPEYIKLMIDNEIKEKKSGFMERIKNLEDLLKKAERINDIVNRNDEDFTELFVVE